MQKPSKAQEAAQPTQDQAAQQQNNHRNVPQWSTLIPETEIKAVQSMIEPAFNAP